MYNKYIYYNNNKTDMMITTFVEERSKKIEIIMKTENNKILEKCEK